jgi:DNA polymerase
MVGFIGEVGEFANLLRHIQRGDKDARTRAHLEEEWTDMLIFLLDIGARLDIDAERNYEAKMRYNETRFRSSEKPLEVEDMQELERLALDWEQCISCELCANRKCGVFDKKADLSIQSGVMFVGEGPGAKEQEAGIPFVGPAGKVLDSVLLHLHLTRAQVYISNTVKCRAQDGSGKDRQPSFKESETCKCWLSSEVEILKPKVIVPLGQVAFNQVTQRSNIGGISGFAGKRYTETLSELANGAIIVPLVHPAACLYGFKKEEYLSHVQSLYEILKEEKIV